MSKYDRPLVRTREREAKVELLGLLAKSSMRWSELETELIGKSNWFRSNRDLSRALHSLVKEGNVVRKKIRHKNVLYILSSDAIIFVESMEKWKESEKRFPKIVDGIRKAKEDLSPQQAERYVAALVFTELKIFLDGLAHAVRVETKWAFYARFLLDRFVDRFGRLLIVCGKTFPDLMDGVVESAKRELEELTISYAPKEPEVRKKKG